ncbi:DUF5615 family PIN-like protein [Nitrospira defluvii]|nr:DUF5615 family PIN-like protein [Nitrospira defluvii]
MIHISELVGGLRMSDSKVWEAAKDKGQIIVTKDIDFFDMSIRRGSPPIVLLIRYGNCSNAEMIRYLSNSWKELGARLDKTDARLTTLTRETMEVHQR